MNDRRSHARAWLAKAASAHIVLSAALLALIAVACEERSPLAPDAVTSTETFIRALEQQGLTVVREAEMPRESFPFVAVRAQPLRTSGERVYVFEYATADAALADAPKISGGATSLILWIDTPRFYRHGRLIVLYVGHREDVIRALDAVLGQPFACC